MYMLLMGECREIKPVSAAVQKTLQLNLASYCWQWSFCVESSARDMIPHCMLLIGIIVSM